MSAQLALPDHGWQRLRWERGTRYYEAVLHQDLWAGWVPTRARGSSRDHYCQEVRADGIIANNNVSGPLSPVSPDCCPVG